MKSKYFGHNAQKVDGNQKYDIWSKIDVIHSREENTIRSLLVDIRMNSHYKGLGVAGAAYNGSIWYTDGYIQECTSCLQEVRHGCIVITEIHSSIAGGSHQYLHTYSTLKTAGGHVYGSVCHQRVTTVRRTKCHSSSNRVQCIIQTSLNVSTALVDPSMADDSV